MKILLLKKKRCIKQNKVPIKKNRKSKRNVVFFSQFGVHAARKRHCYVSGTYGLIVSKPGSLIKYTSEYNNTTYYFLHTF
jgi:hypothetical protein